MASATMGERVVPRYVPADLSRICDRAYTDLHREQGFLADHTGWICRPPQWMRSRLSRRKTWNDLPSRGIRFPVVTGR